MSPLLKEQQFGQFVLLPRKTYRKGLFDVDDTALLCREGQGDHQLFHLANVEVLLCKSTLASKNLSFPLVGVHPHCKIGRRHSSGWAGERDVRGRVYEFAKATARSLLLEATEPTNGLDYQKVVSLAKKASSAGGIANMVKLARTDPRLVILPEQLDANPCLFNTCSGTLDLSDPNAIVLRPWRAADLISRIAPVQYDPRARCPMFERFVARIFAERDELMAYVQRFLGSTLVGKVHEETFHIGTGTGANGKSTLVEIVRAIYGEDQYMGSLPLNALAMKKQDVIPSDIAAIVGTRLVTAVETEGGRQLAEALIKMLSGRDYTKTRAMYEDWFGFTPTFRLLMMTNHLPKIQHQDEGIWRRIHVIPFDVSIPRAEQDGGLRDRIVAREGPGVLNWLIAGYQAYCTRGYDPPAEVTAATADYRVAEDAVGRFVEEVVMTEVMGGRTVGMVTFKKMYDAFTRWCADFGHQLVPGPDFHARLKRRFEQGRGKQGMHYKGVQLAADYGSDGLRAA